MRTRVPLSLAAFGERKTILEWTQDPRCQVSLRELRTRLEKGWDIEAALSTNSVVRPSRARNFISAFGEDKSIAEWAKDPRAMVSGLTIAARVQRGWPSEEAITTPVHGKVRPPRPVISRPPHTRRQRGSSLREAVSAMTEAQVLERLNAGAELWFAGSSNGRVTLVDEDKTSLISADVLKQLIEEGKVEVLDQVGTVLQYGIAQGTAVSDTV